MADMKKLLKTITALQVNKGHRNDYGGYYYRNAEDILAALKPLMTANGIIPIITDTIEQVGDRYYVKATVSVYDADTSELIATNTAYAREPINRKGMDEAQVTGSSSSYARKYALAGIFNLAPSDEPQEQPVCDPDGMNASRARSKSNDKKVEKLTEMLAKSGIDINDFSVVAWGCNISQASIGNIDYALNNFDDGVKFYKANVGKRTA